MSGEKKSMFCLFRAYGEGDGETVFNLLKICDSIQKAKELITKKYIIKEIEDENIVMEDKYMRDFHEDYCFVHKTMTPSNHFTFIGKRVECKGACNYQRFGGFIIENMLVEK